VARLETLAPERIVVEATGGYETLLVAACIAANLPIVVVNPLSLVKTPSSLISLAFS
jgi:transposase